MTTYSEQHAVTYNRQLLTFTRAIVNALGARYQNEPYGLGNANTIFPISAYITHLVHLEGSTVAVDVAAIAVS